MIGQDTSKTGYIDQWEGRRPVLPNMEVVEDSLLLVLGGWVTSGESDYSDVLAMAVLGCQENILHISQ